MQTIMQNKICMVTGATSGMGKETAAALAQMGTTVILVARNQNKGETVRDEIRMRSGNMNVEVMYADLSSQRSIRELAETFKQHYQHLHVLVNNAGGIFFTRETTVDGVEMTLAVNHLAPFLLTDQLLDVLKASVPARIINISSNVESIGTINFDDLQHEKRYISIVAYAQAKLATMLFTYELARRVEGTGITVNAVTPGPVATKFGSNGNHVMNKIFPLLFRFAKSSEEGAQTAIYLASSPMVEGMTGKAFYSRKELRSSRKSYSTILQKKVWQVSEDFTDAKKVTKQKITHYQTWLNVGARAQTLLHVSYCFNNQLVFHLFYAFVQRFFGIVILYEHLLPTDHRASIDLWHDVVYGAPCHSHIGFESTFNDM